MLERVRIIVAGVLGLPAGEVRPDSSPDTLPVWDSLQHMNLVLALEREFGLQFTPEEIEELLSVELAAALVEEKRNGRGAAHVR